VYFAEEMMKHNKTSFKGKTVAVSGSGNVAQYAIEKATQLGAKVVTASDSDGSIYDPAGINGEKLAFIMELKNVKRGRIEEYAKKFKGAPTRRARVCGTWWPSAMWHCPAPRRTSWTARTPRTW
jgi:glutamate dehydrogenase (NADP+)